MSGQDIQRAAIDLYDRFTHGGMDRRWFMAELARLAGGTAAASVMLTGLASCADAAPIAPTADRRLRLEDLDWEVRPGRQLQIYHAAPALGNERRPAVVVIHENRGLTPHIRDVARRAALAGFDAYAPDFLTPLGGTPADEDVAREMIGRLELPEAAADGAALIRRLRGSDGSGKVGVVGFCWGGAMVHRLAIAAGTDLDAGVSFYGPAPDPAEASRVQAPLLIILASRDSRVNGTAGPWVSALEAAGRPVRAITYPDVDHAFHNDTSAARYNRAAAEQAWGETTGFFGERLRGTAR